MLSKSDSDLSVTDDHVIDRSLICVICHDVLKDPRECSFCQNCFCKSCISNWLDSKESCPFRCPEVQLRAPHKIVIESLKTINFKCINAGCNETLNYSKYLRHSEECDFKKILCSQLTCSREILKKDEKFHLENECEGKLHICANCGFEVVGAAKVPHECENYARSLMIDLKFRIGKLNSNVNARIKSFRGRLEVLRGLVNESI